MLFLFYFYFLSHCTLHSVGLSIFNDMVLTNHSHFSFIFIYFKQVFSLYINTLIIILYLQQISWMWTIKSQFWTILKKFRNTCCWKRGSCYTCWSWFTNRTRMAYNTSRNIGIRSGTHRTTSTRITST